MSTQSFKLIRIRNFFFFFFCDNDTDILILKAITQTFIKPLNIYFTNKKLNNQMQISSIN